MQFSRLDLRSNQNDPDIFFFFTDCINSQKYCNVIITNIYTNWTLSDSFLLRMVTPPKGMFGWRLFDWLCELSYQVPSCSSGGVDELLNRADLWQLGAGS